VVLDLVEAGRDVLLDGVVLTPDLQGDQGRPQVPGLALLGEAVVLVLVLVVVGRRRAV
jgi:hypothetical protein